MMEFEFALKFMLPAGGANADELVERLGEAGCNDAVVGIGQAGRIALDFIREAESTKLAIFSALEGVKRAIPEAKLLEVTPDYVGLTDIAEFTNVSRQNMRKLMLVHKSNLPAALHEGSIALWHLYPVLRWLEQRPGYTIKQPLLETAHIAMQINLTKEAGQIERDVESELIEAVA